MKPYAYAVVQGEDDRENVSLQFDHPEMCGQKYRQAIPLFTHPSELTDEEIYTTIFESGFDKELFMQNINSGVEPISLTLAKAILRKASEK